MALVVSLAMVGKRGGDQDRKLHEAFVALSKQVPDRRVTLREHVEKHRDWIGKLVGQGHSYGRIAEAMTAKGVKISQHTLRQYFTQGGELTAGPVGSTRSNAATRATPSAAPATVVRDQATDASRPATKLEAPDTARKTFKPVLPGETEL